MADSAVTSGGGARGRRAYDEGSRVLLEQRGELGFGTRFDRVRLHTDNF